jgi:hypothetical protein
VDQYIVLTVYIPAQFKPCFVRIKHKLWVKKTIKNKIPETICVIKFLLHIVDTEDYAQLSCCKAVTN